MTMQRFDPAAVAAKALQDGVDPLQAVVGQAVGYSVRAIEAEEESGMRYAGAATDAVTIWIAAQLEAASAGQRVGRLEEGDRLLLLAGDDLGVERAKETRDALQAAISGEGPVVTILAGMGAAIVVAARAPEVILDAEIEQDGDRA